MAKKTDQTASFMVRFTQQLFEEDGKSNVQWRGKISHVQGNEEINFTGFKDALSFMQSKLQLLTEAATAGKPENERAGLISKSFDIWKRVAQTGPKMILDTIKDPKKQVSQIQGQIQEQMSVLGDEISTRVGIDDWRTASKNDYKGLINSIETLQNDMKSLHKKVDKIAKKK